MSHVASDGCYKEQALLLEKGDVGGKFSRYTQYLSSCLSSGLISYSSLNSNFQFRLFYFLVPEQGHEPWTLRFKFPFLRSVTHVLSKVFFDDFLDVLV